MSYEAHEGVYERFAKFHYHNPHVYRLVVRMCRYIKASGVDNFGIALVFERLRWLYQFETHHPDDVYRLNNNLRAPMARLIMASEADLKDFFRTRKSQSDEHFAGESTPPGVAHEDAIA